MALLDGESRHATAGGEWAGIPVHRNNHSVSWRWCGFYSPSVLPFWSLSWYSSEILEHGARKTIPWGRYTRVKCFKGDWNDKSDVHQQPPSHGHVGGFPPSLGEWMRQQAWMEAWASGFMNESCCLLRVFVSPATKWS